MQKPGKKMKGRHIIKKLKRKKILKEVGMKAIKCLHKKTVALNEEGHAGVYCVSCGEKISGET